MILDTTCENFLNDDGIEVYLGARDYELKYYDYDKKEAKEFPMKNNPNKKYTPFMARS